MNRNKAVPAAYILLEKDGKYLFGRRQGTKYFAGFYQMPAGHVEEAELPIDAVIRETKEEIGVILDKKDLVLAHSMYRAKKDETGNRADYFFITRKWIGEPRNMEPDKCDDLKWFTISELPQNTVPHAKFALECVKNGVVYSEIP